MRTENAMGMALPSSFQRNADHVARHSCEVVEHRWVNSRYKYLRLAADAELAQCTRAGQFYQLQCPDTAGLHPFLLRPMSVYGLGPEPGTIEFLYNVTGLGTQALATLVVGSTMHIVGPLGNSFSFSSDFQHVMVVARGVGLATMAPLVQLADQNGVAVTAVLSARSPQDCMRSEFLRGSKAQVHEIYDSDASSSMHSLEALLHQLLDNANINALYTCGSHRIVTLLQKLQPRYPKLMAEVAMEQRMACGMGVCLSCVRMFERDGEKQFKRVCREGPVFPLRDVVGEMEFG